LCSSCGFSFVNPRPSLSFIMNYYSKKGHIYNNNINGIPTLESVLSEELNYPNSTLDAQRIIRKIESLSNKVHKTRFLDIGCGNGFFSNFALSTGFEVVALELGENEREITKKMTGLNPLSCSFEEFEFAPESFQVVLMSQIFEHALDINLWLSKAHNLLVKNGIIAIALPNFGNIFRLILQENEPFICPPQHLNFFNPRSLTLLLEKHGFRVEEIQWISRIPKSTIEKYFSKLGKPLIPIMNAFASLTLKTIDSLHLGIMINVYARKTSEK
jgi:2-polyprenyl-3-methyl-5-hydroxy-6-metoxy-1,4-benzoquinol methylase